MYLISEALSIYTFQPHIKELFMHLNELPKESEESVQTTYYYKVRGFEKNTSANFRERRKRLQLTELCRKHPKRRQLHKKIINTCKIQILKNNKKGKKTAEFE